MSLDGQQYPHEDLRKQSRSRWPLTKGKEEKKKENLTEQLCRKVFNLSEASNTYIFKCSDSLI